MSGLFICIISEKCLKHVWDTVDISGKNDLKSFDFKISEVHGFYYIIILNKTVIQNTVTYITCTLTCWLFSHFKLKK